MRMNDRSTFYIYIKIYICENITRLGVVLHTCNSNYWGGTRLEDHSSRPVPGKMPNSI
jgi:hypothetical protein